MKELNRRIKQRKAGRLFPGIQGQAAFVALALGFVAAGTRAHAGSATYDFSTDPTQDPKIVINGGNDTPWLATGGNPGGFLALLYSIGSTAETVVFPDIDNGQTVASFTFETDLRVGNAQGNGGRPADGFSVSFARANDPVLADLPTSADPNNFAAAGQPEDGTATGIAIGFDTWQGNVLPDDPTGDIEGIIVRVDNKTILKNPMPTRNGACDDPTSMQTGPYNDAYWTNGGDPHDPQAWAGLCWAHLKVELDPQGKLTVTWKNKVLLDHYQTTYFPSVGRLILAGRTGGANENTHFDNIKITTTASSDPLVTGLNGTGFGFKAEITDATGAAVDTTSVTAKLNGTAVTPQSVTKSGNITTITYTNSTIQTSGGTYAVDLAYKDTNGKSYTASRSYIAPTYTTLPPTFATAAGAVDKTKSGFLVRPYQTAAAQPNTIQWTEEQLAGQHGPNIATTAGTDANGFLTYTGVVNWDKVSTSAADGNFTDATGYPDVELPGFPGSNADYANAAEEVLTYLEFPSSGFYTMGVNSDDGFKVTSGTNPRDMVFSLVAGYFDGGRGASDTLFNIYVPQAGIYPFRLLWENGGSGANCEWFTVLSDGTKVLINDSKNANSIKAYSSGPARPPYTSNFDGVGSLLIKDDQTQLTATSVKVTVNGTAATATATKSGNATTVTFQPVLPPSSTNVLGLVMTDSAGTTISNSTTVVTPAYATLTASMASAAADVDTTKPGFRVRPYQSTNAQPNTLAWTEDQLAGKNGANIAVTTGADASGFITVPGVINFDKVSTGAADGNFTDATGYPDAELPGLPGANGDYNNAAEEILTFLQFPTAGVYRMGVNSDDGFRVTAGFNPAIYPPAVVLGQFDAGRGASDTIFPVNVQQAGIYPFRLIWENGGSGANLEWFSVNLDGTKTLINDSKSANAIKAYAVGKTSTNQPPADLTLSIARSSSGLTLTYTGTLQGADQVQGPYTDVPGATSPASITPSGAAKFYRVRQ